jgi:pantetheine-phosphate adenylyltransferase
MKIAIYPGTFDPITRGHLDIVKRAAQLFDRVIVAVSTNLQKDPLFSLEERRRLVEQTVKELTNVEVDVFCELLVSYARKKKADVIIRGLRAVSDFEYEFQMALINRKLAPDLVTVYLMPGEKYTYLNSTIVKEVARLGGQVDCFLTPPVVELLKQKLKPSDEDTD